MAKDVVINTSRLNSYGTRILTSGVNIEQYKKNPVLLYMHQRGNVIGRIENLRFDGDRLIGTPVFDMDDEFAAKIARKWDKGFINMCSGGFDPLEMSSDTQYLVPGQTRATVIRSSLVEVSITDIGSNDDALKLYAPDGELLTLAAGTESNLVPLLSAYPADDPAQDAAPAQEGDNQTINTQPTITMNKILATLNLSATSTEDEVVAAIARIQAEAGKVAAIELSRITAAVDQAINKDKKVTADKRETLITLGKTAGYDVLQSTLDMLTPARKPSDIIHASDGAGAQKQTLNLSYSQMPEQELLDLRTNNVAEYIRLYKAEFGFVPTID